MLVNNPALDTTPQDLQNQTSIVLGEGNKLIVAYDDSGPFSLDNPTTLGYSVSANGGGSFSDKGTLSPTPPYYTLGDPALARSTNTGTVFLSAITTTTSPAGLNFLADRINVFRSTNNGADFGAPINGTPGFGTGEYHFGRDWIAVDNYPGPGYGNVYLAWSASRNGGDWGVCVTRSTDDGLTWGPNRGTGVEVKPGNPQCLGTSLTVGPDHTVYVTCFTLNELGKSKDIVMCRSTDQGQTFGDSMVVTGLRTNGFVGDLGLTDGNGQTFRTYVLPQAAVNPVTGDIYMICPDKPKGPADKADIFFTQSSDGGNTWSDPLRVNDDATTNDQWQPALAVTLDGSHVGIFWYDRRLDPANDLIDRYGAIGSLSGHTVTFGANFHITDVSFPAARGVDPVFPSWYAATGEYDQAVADNAYFYTTWGDNRLANAFHANQPDVRLAKVPVDWQGTNASLLVASGVATAPSSTARRDYTALIAAAMYEQTSWRTAAVDQVFSDLASTPRKRNLHNLGPDLAGTDLMLPS